MDIGFQADDHRLVGKSQALHLAGGAAHDQGFSRSDLVVADAPAILCEHVNRILLARIEIFNTQGFQVQVGELLMGAVVFGSDEAVELAVVEIGQILLKFRGLRFEPVGKAAADLVDFGIGELYALAVPDFYPYSLAVLILCFHGFGNIRRGVVQGVPHQAQTVEVAVVAAHIVFVGDVGIFFPCRN